MIYINNRFEFYNSIIIILFPIKNYKKYFNVSNPFFKSEIIFVEKNHYQFFCFIQDKYFYTTKFHLSNGIKNYLRSIIKFF